MTTVVIQDDQTMYVVCDVSDEKKPLRLGLAFASESDATKNIASLRQSLVLERLGISQDQLNDATSKIKIEVRKFTLVEKSDSPDVKKPDKT